MPDARCPMPDARCPMPDARCPMPDTRCLKPYSAVAIVLLFLFSYYKILYKLAHFLIQQKKIVLFLIICAIANNYAIAQNCTTSLNNNVTNICGTGCNNITVSIPHLKQTSDYKVRQKTYKPYPYTTPTGIVDPWVLNNNTNSFVPIALPFSFCFYDSAFKYLTISANGLLTFDTTNKGLCISNGAGPFPMPMNIGTQCSGGIYVPKAAVMAIMTDLDPRNGFEQPSAPDRKIEYRIEGTAPCRRFIASYYKIGTFGCWDEPGCWPNGQSTFQTVLYESSGLIEINVETYTCNRPWASGGLATMGIQNWNRDKAVCPPGKNAAIWQSVQESYEFIPSAGASRYINSKIYTIGGALIANADTSGIANGMLNLKFNNVCTTTDTTKYIVRTSYTACPTNALITYDDTITVVRIPSTINATAITTPSCGNDGNITITATGGTGYTYALNNGSPQASNTFNNLAAGNYTATATSNNGCSKTINVTIPTNTVTITTRNDTAFCLGDAIVLQTNSNATNYTWLPTTGLNNATIQNPIATPLVTTTYFVFGNRGNCFGKDTVTITVLPRPSVNAGQDVTVIKGYDAQLGGIVYDANSYVWSPTTYLSNANSLYPNVQQPTTTTLYKLTATANNGCQASDDIVVTVLPYCVAVKEAFTPNGDGINDLWLVYNSLSCLQNVQVQVSNRYGSIVYSNTNYTNNWDGTYKGKPVPDGTYYYSIKYTFANGTQYVAKGNVTILR
jgi:gliding motility-associated-like protein